MSISLPLSASQVVAPKQTGSSISAWNRATWNRLELERRCEAGLSVLEAWADAATREAEAALTCLTAAAKQPVSSEDPPFDAKDAEKCEACNGTGERECTEHLGVPGSEYDATRECEVCDGLGYVRRGGRQ